MELKRRIEAIWRESDGTYGCPRIHAALRAEGRPINRKRVARLMRELKIAGVTRRRFKTDTTRRRPGARPAPDLVERDFSADGPDKLWVADVTQVRTGAGWLYLAGAATGGALFLRGSVRLVRDPSRRSAMANFHASLAQLGLLLLGALADAAF